MVPVRPLSHYHPVCREEAALVRLPWAHRRVCWRHVYCGRDSGLYHLYHRQHLQEARAWKAELRNSSSADQTRRNKKHFPFNFSNLPVQLCHFHHLHFIIFSLCFLGGEQVEKESFCHGLCCMFQSFGILLLLPLLCLCTLKNQQTVR